MVRRTRVQEWWETLFQNLILRLNEVIREYFSYYINNHFYLCSRKISNFVFTAELEMVIRIVNIVTYNSERRNTLTFTPQRFKIQESREIDPFSKSVKYLWRKGRATTGVCDHDHNSIAMLHWYNSLSGKGRPRVSSPQLSS